ncbi:MAG: flippase [Ignavibacteriales bacterium]|nr:flippase [Ignavibacteriales bacterium]
MLDKILRLGKEAAIYGLSSILGRFLNFLLVPFYTNYLLPSEYGVVATLYAYIAFMVIVYGYGMEAAYMRFVSPSEPGDTKRNFSTPFLSLLVTSALFSLVIHLSADSVAGWIEIGEEHADLVRYAGWILFFDTLVAIPYASLRMEHKALKFAGLRVLNIVSNIALNILFIVGMDMKADGVFLANLLAMMISFILLFRTVMARLTISFSRGLYRDLLKFGLPYVPAGIAGAAMQVIDRPILKMLTNDATVGVYQANYRLGVLMMLVVGMFDYAWRPFFLQHAKDEDAKELFAKVFTYFVALMLFILVSVSLFVEDLVRIQVFGKYFIHPDYWGGLTIVPIILLSYVFTGAYVNFVVGIYLEKKTKVLPYVTGAGAIVNVLVNFWSIPRYGMMGAAFATLASYVVMAAGMYIASQQVYPMRYEWSRILRLAAVAAVVFAGASMVPVEPATLIGLVMKAGWCLLFLLFAFLVRAFDPADIISARQALSKLLGRR